MSWCYWYRILSELSLDLYCVVNYHCSATNRCPFWKCTSTFCGQQPILVLAKLVPVRWEFMMDSRAIFECPGGAEAVEINRRHNCFGCEESWSFLLQEFGMWSNISAESGNHCVKRLWWMQSRWVALIELLSLKWSMTKLTWSALYPECAGKTYLSATWMGKSQFCRWCRCKHFGVLVWPKKLWFCISQIKWMCELYLWWSKGVNKLS